MSNLKTEIYRDVQLTVSPDRAYQLIAEADNIERWFCDRVAQSGNVLEFIWKMQDGGKSGFEVEIVEAVHGKRFVYRSVDDFPTITAFDLAPVGNGTQVILVETFDPDTPDIDILYSEHSGGWDWFLSRLSGLT